MSFKFSKLFWIGLTLILLGILSYICEMTFYNGIDENNVIQESLFLPLTFILGFIGVIFMIISGVTNAIKKYK